MLRLTLAQMRRSAGRLAAAGVAIALGSAFVAVTLLVSNVIDRAMVDSAAARYGQADLTVAWPDGRSMSPADVSAVRSLPEVAAADPLDDTYLTLRSDEEVYVQLAVGTSSDPRLAVQELAAGHLPTTRDQIALPVHTADQLHVEPGATIEVDVPTPDGKRTTATVTVTGTVDDPYGAFRSQGGAAVVDAAQLHTWAEQQAGAPDTFSGLALLVAPGHDTAEVTAAVDALHPGARIQTREQVAHARASQLTGDKDVFTAVVLTFAAISLVVAALVISNTFQVLVAQRARLLALLRCVGATRAQLARSVLTEAGLLGAVSSVAGVAGGLLLAQLALVVAQSYTDLPLPSTVTVSVTALVLPVVVGTAVTLVAGLVPARAATRVAPLAALRPADAPRLARQAGAARGVAALLLTVGGAAVMALGVVVGRVGQPGPGLAAAVLGGTASLVGILLGAVFWMPRVVAVAGRALASFGAGSQLAAANVRRNPRRTTATATALLIGVTLVAMMSTGAATASRTLATSLDATFPYDIGVDVYGQNEDDGTAGDDADDHASLTPADVDALRQIDGVAQVAAVTSTIVVVHGGDAADLTLYGIAPGDTSALRDRSALEGLRDGVVLVGDVADWDSSAGLAPGQSVRLEGTGAGQVDDDGSYVPDGHQIEARVADAPHFAFGDAYVTAETMHRLDPDAPTDRVWLRVADDADPSAVADHVRSTLSDAGYSVAVIGAAAERTGTQHVIDTLLRVVLGLLAVAVVIAVIGVANTLSLSVIERRRESATLRALGLTRGRLRWMLAEEGMLVAGVGAATGLVLGVLYGWAGASAALAATGGVRLATPWATLGAVLVGAIVAGLLASVLPGRSAARTPPVAALAVD